MEVAVLGYTKENDFSLFGCLVVFFLTLLNFLWNGWVLVKQDRSR